jgi:hypothetical protein
MIRKLGLIYRRDKALSKAALGFIQVTLAHFGSPAAGHVSAAARDTKQPAAVTPIPV